MNLDRLKVTAVDNNSASPTPSNRSNGRREEMRAKMERLWLQNPEQFNPLRSSMERQRIQRTMQTIQETVTLPVGRVVDLGCGYGEITKKLCALGCQVDAVDIAENALQHLKSEGETSLQSVSLIQDCLPATRLVDEAYGLVVCTDVIGYLDPNEYRFLFSELARLVSKDGHVVCSAELDVDTDDPLERFASLAETEFNFDTWTFGYHRLYIKLCRFFDAPKNFSLAGSDAQKRKKESDRKHGIGKFWFCINSSFIGSKCWGLVSYLATPLANVIRQSTTLLNLLESVSRFLWSDAAISHALFIGKRRPLTYQVAADKKPLEMKHKRQVWE